MLFTLFTIQIYRQRNCFSITTIVLFSFSTIKCADLTISSHERDNPSSRKSNTNKKKEQIHWFFGVCTIKCSLASHYCGKKPQCKRRNKSQKITAHFQSFVLATEATCNLGAVTSTIGCELKAYELPVPIMFLKE